MKLLFLIFPMIFSLPAAWSGDDDDNLHYNYSTGLTDEQQKEVNEFVNTEYIAAEAAKACDILRKELKGEKLSEDEQLFFEDMTAEEKKAYNEIGDISKNSRTGSKRFDGSFDPCSASNDALIGAVFGETGDQLFEMIAKSYSMIMGMSAMSGGGKIEMKTDSAKYKQSKTSLKQNQKDLKGLEKADNPNATKIAEEKKNIKTDQDAMNKETEEKNDLCVYIPMAMEMVATTTLQVQGDNIASEQAETIKLENQQMEAFYQSGRMQHSRKTVADMQFYSWGATAVCYAGYMVAGAVTDFKLLAKTAGAALLATYYKTKSKRHKRAEAYFNFMATKFSNMKGKCNPITEKQCYCSLESRTNEPYCMPPNWKSRAEQPGQIIGCVDTALKEDPDCKCLQRNDCFDVRVRKISGYADFGPSMFGPALDNSSPIFAGRYNTSSMNNLADQQLAAVRRLLKKKAGDLPSKVGKVNLNPSQMTQAQKYAKLGFPVRLARQMASTPSSAKGKSMVAKLKGNSAKKGLARMKRYSRSGGRVVNYGANRKKGKTTKAKAAYNPFAKFGKGKKDKKKQTGQIMNFAERAREKAQIQKDTGRPIFEIISHRYRVSTWRKFNVMDIKP